MPVYNSERLLRRALDSVLAQDHAHFEVIVSDDGSQDATPQIVAEYAARDPRLRASAAPTHGGPLPNFQRVLDLAQGEFFMWAAHDDYREANYISALLRPLLADERLGLACAQFVKVTPAGKHISRHPFPDAAGEPVRRLRGLMRGSGAPWVYGLYRTAQLRPVFARVHRANLVWFWDHLVILNFLLNNQLTGVNDTTIYQVKTGFSAGVFRPKTLPAHLAFAARVLAQCFDILRRARLTPGQKLRLAPYLALYTEMQVFHVRRWAPAQRGLRAVRRRAQARKRA
jgi:glycosyltransferase involved in cell wall biosynthesis